MPRNIHLFNKACQFIIPMSYLGFKCNIYNLLLVQGLQRIKYYNSYNYYIIPVLYSLLKLQVKTILHVYYIPLLYLQWY